MEEALAILYKEFRAGRRDAIFNLGGQDLMRLLQARNAMETCATAVLPYMERIEALEKELAALRSEMTKKLSVCKKAAEFYEERKALLITDDIVREVLDIESDALASEVEEEDIFDADAINKITDRMMIENPPPLTQLMNGAAKSGGNAKKQRMTLPSQLGTRYLGLAGGTCVYCGGPEKTCVCPCVVCSEERRSCREDCFFVSERTRCAYESMRCKAEDSSTKKNSYAAAVSEWRSAIAVDFQHRNAEGSTLGKFETTRDALKEQYKKGVSPFCVVCLRDGEQRGGVCRQCKTFPSAKK